MLHIFVNFSSINNLLRVGNTFSTAHPPKVDISAQLGPLGSECQNDFVVASLHDVSILFHKVKIVIESPIKSINRSRLSHIFSKGYLF